MTGPGNVTVVTLVVIDLASLFISEVQYNFLNP